MGDELVSRQETEKSNLGTTLCRLEEENVDLQRQVQNLQAQLSEVESQHAQRYGSSYERLIRLTIILYKSIPLEASVSSTKYVFNIVS